MPPKPKFKKEEMIRTKNKKVAFVNPAERLDYKYYILRRLLFEKKQHFGDCGLTGRL